MYSAFNLHSKASCTWFYASRTFDPTATVPEFIRQLPIAVPHLLSKCRDTRVTTEKMSYSEQGIDTEAIKILSRAQTHAEKIVS